MFLAMDQAAGTMLHGTSPCRTCSSCFLHHMHAPNQMCRYWQVRGFSGRAWMADNRTKVVPALSAMATLISAGKLHLEHTE